MGNKGNKKVKKTHAWRKRTAIHMCSIARESVPPNSNNESTISGAIKNQDNSEIERECEADDIKPEKQGHTPVEVNAPVKKEVDILIELSEELKDPPLFGGSSSSSPSSSNGSWEGAASDKEPWLVRQQLCRCCHSEGAFWSLQTRVGGATYAHLLHTYFNVQMCEVPSSLEALSAICAVCAARLRDVREFSAQVRSAEERFKRMYAQNRLKVAPTKTEIKEELPNDPDERILDHDDAVNFPVIDEERPKLESKRKKVSGDECPSKAKRTKTPAYRLTPADYERHGDTLKCTRCDKPFTTLKGLRYHVKSLHMNIAKYTCSHCSKTFRTLASFTKHKLDEHSIDDRFKCNACDSKFNNGIQLVKHKNNFHMLGVKHACPHCDYVCFSVEAMFKHEFKHKSVKEYHCQYCRKSFLRKNTLALHERIHTGDRRKVCNECGQAFVQKASLNYHMTKYHPEVKF